MAKDKIEQQESTEEEQKEEDTEERLYRIVHNLPDEQIIVLRRNTQRYLNNLPEEERVSLGMVNKQGDNRLYFRSTKTRAFRILDRLEGHAKDWSYINANLKIETVEEEPENMLNSEDLERLEDKISESYKDEMGRLHMQIGSLNSDLSRAKEDLNIMQERALTAEVSASRTNSKVTELNETIESLRSLKETLAKGTLVDACTQFINARAENVEILELLLADIKESGLDIGFISSPPDSVERYAKEKILQTLNIELDYHELGRCIEIGKAETWEASRLFLPTDELDAAQEKITKLTGIITSADDNVKEILEENLKTVITELNGQVAEYKSKRQRYNESRLAYTAYQKAIEEGTDELAKAKQLKSSLSDLRKMKFPVYAVPEQDGATVYLPVASGIAYDSVIEAIKTHAHIKAEEEIGGNTVLRIGGNSDWDPLKVLKRIKKSYENSSEAGQIGSKLGLLVQV
ncbi:hypothetical protein GF343_05075 [Candidatus Woesearchaeota archaeon]|nr:hypothetical protein [Candidatus Woesearchaeota archaeon]